MRNTPSEPNSSAASSGAELLPSKYRPAIKLQTEVDVEEVTGFLAERGGALRGAGRERGQVAVRIDGGVLELVADLTHLGPGIEEPEREDDAEQVGHVDAHQRRDLQARTHVVRADLHAAVGSVEKRGLVVAVDHEAGDREPQHREP